MEHNGPRTAPGRCAAARSHPHPLPQRTAHIPGQEPCPARSAHSFSSSRPVRVSGAMPYTLRA
ncbi:hypothetical protein BC628DRAFT_1405477 [Trametes gibbosa]|nr:hypothetical protein BC628DRAFT_1405477 [Trametes gibbosa]